MTDKPKRFELWRSFVLADVITLGNAASGTLAILLCLEYLAEGALQKLHWALALFPLALVCDVLDGTVARWRNRHSPFGQDLDSLSDVISFGVAPAVLGYTLGLRGAIDVLILVYFVACGISRLARFNVTAAALAEPGGKVKYYEGTPIPTSVLLVGVLALALFRGAVHEHLWFGALKIGPFTFHPLALMFAASGSLMVSSRIRIPKP